MSRSNFYKLGSFIKKDYLIESSYKLNFILTFLSSIFPIATVYFIGKMLNSASFEITRYGGKYFPFALIGVAFCRFFQVAIDTFSGNIKRSQMAGCLEAILSSQTGAKSVVLFSAIYSFISALIQLIVMLILSCALFNFGLLNINIPASLLVFFLSLVIFISLGILSAAGTVVFKQGEPVAWLFGLLSSLLGGAMFPVQLMPSWMQLIAKAFPITYTLDALRLAMLNNYSIAMLSSELLILLIIALILFPLSLIIFEFTIEKGKRDGTLMLY